MIAVLIRIQDVDDGNCVCAPCVRGCACMCAWVRGCELVYLCVVPVPVCVCQWELERVRACVRVRVCGGARGEGGTVCLGSWRSVCVAGCGSSSLRNTRRKRCGNNLNCVPARAGRRSCTKSCSQPNIPESNNQAVLSELMHAYEKRG